MGCCASTTNKVPAVAHSHRHSSASRSESSRHLKPSRAPPPSFEEETVKEVLSETPSTKPPRPKIDDEEMRNAVKFAVHKIRDYEDEISNADKKPLMVAAEEISEVSEICSLSESVSTTTCTEKRDDGEGEVRQKVNRSPAKFRNRSLSGDLSGKRDGTVGKSPVRRTDSSPTRVKSVSAKDKRVLMTDGQRRQARDSSGMRSRSPATRTDGGAKQPGLRRSPSARRSGKSPARGRSELTEKTQKVEETNREGGWAPTSNESFENPLVSLECFIFL